MKWVTSFSISDNGAQEQLSSQPQVLGFSGHASHTFRRSYTCPTKGLSSSFSSCVIRCMYDLIGAEIFLRESKWKSICKYKCTEILMDIESIFIKQRCIKTELTGCDTSQHQLHNSCFMHCKWLIART